MIPVKSFPVYAQYNEDITLLALLHDVNDGFYVDIGANYPTIDSVTKLFYDRGWNGINVEPIRSLHSMLLKDRPRDINLQLGVGDTAGTLEFFENTDIPGHSSFIKNNAGDKNTDKVISYKVEVQTLQKIFNTNNVTTINFLKIDVEGFEESVIEGNDWKKYRPEVLCIEISHRTNNWQSKLVHSGYRMFISDGLNEYYIADESWHRTEGFSERIVALSYHALRQYQYDSWSVDAKQLRKLTRLNQIHFGLLQDALHNNKILEDQARSQQH